MARPKWGPFLIPTKKPLNAYNLILGRSELERMRAGPDVLQVNVAWQTIRFTVTNTGKRAGAEIAELYVGEKNPTVPRPIKELKGFQKVLL